MSASSPARSRGPESTPAPGKPPTPPWWPHFDGQGWSLWRTLYQGCMLSLTQRLPAELKVDVHEVQWRARVTQ